MLTVLKLNKGNCENKMRSSKEGIGRHVFKVGACWATYAILPGVMVPAVTARFQVLSSRADYTVLHRVVRLCGTCRFQKRPPRADRAVARAMTKVGPRGTQLTVANAGPLCARQISSRRAGNTIFGIIVQCRVRPFVRQVTPRGTRDAIVWTHRDPAAIANGSRRAHNDRKRDRVHRALKHAAAGTYGRVHQ